MEKSKAMEKKSVGYWSTLGGVELKDIEYGIDDYALVVSGAWIGKQKMHRLKIHYTVDDGYIRVYGLRLHFSDCLRVD